MAPGFTFGSQSLQSPWLGVQPSLSMSAFGSVTLHVDVPPELAEASPKLGGVLPLLLAPLELVEEPELPEEPLDPPGGANPVCCPLLEQA